MSRRKLVCISGSLLIFFAALFIYRVHVVPGSSLLHTGFESTAIAESLVTHGTFADPFRIPTGPSAFLAPGYPFFIAALMKVFGTGTTGYLALQWSVTLFIALQLALWPWITRRMNLTFAAGFIAAVVWLASGMPRNDVWEAHMVGLISLVLAFTMYLVAESPQSRVKLVLCGLLWGVTLLFSPVTLLVLLGWIAWLLLARRIPRQNIALLAVLASVMILPWTVRNYSVFHKFFFVRDNLGLELDLGNNDCASFSFDLNLASGCFSALHPNDNPDHALLARNLGEIEYLYRHMILARWWITNHPREFLQLTVQRKLAFWMPSAMHYPWRLPRRDAIVTVVNLISIAGLILLWRRSRSTAILFILWLLFFPLAYYFVPYSERYRAPILWATFLPASYAIVSLLRIPLSKFDW